VICFTVAAARPVQDVPQSSGPGRHTSQQRRTTMTASATNLPASATASPRFEKLWSALIDLRQRQIADRQSRSLRDFEPTVLPQIGVDRSAAARSLRDLARH
jgi:hypothetical protein